MFHVMLVAPILGLMAVYGAVVLAVLSIPFCVGMFLQLILTIFGQKRWVLYVPAGLGVLGLTASLIWLIQTLSLPTIFMYWGLYFIALWLTWLVVSQIKKAIAKWIGVK